MSTMFRDSEYVNPDVERAASRIERALADAFKEVRQDLELQLAGLERDGQVLARSTFNTQRVRNIAEHLQTRMREVGFSEVLQAQTEELQRLAEAVLEEADAAGKASMFTETTGQAVDSVLWNAHRELIRDETRVAGLLEDMIVRSTVGSTRWMDLVGKIQTELGHTQRQAMTKAADTLAQFHTMTRVQHFSDAGVKWWWYDGPEDSRTRDWCWHFVGTRVTTEILDKHATDYGRKHPLPPSISLGGWHCRHELSPLVTEKAIRAHRIGPRKVVAAAA